MPANIESCNYTMLCPSSGDASDRVLAIQRSLAMARSMKSVTSAGAEAQRKLKAIARRRSSSGGSITAMMDAASSPTATDKPAGQLSASARKSADAAAALKAALTGASPAHADPASLPGKAPSQLSASAQRSAEAAASLSAKTRAAMNPLLRTERAFASSSAPSSGSAAALTKDGDMLMGENPMMAARRAVQDAEAAKRKQARGHTDVHLSDAADDANAAAIISTPSPVSISASARAKILGKHHKPVATAGATSPVLPPRDASASMALYRSSTPGGTPADSRSPSRSASRSRLLSNGADLA